MEVIIKMYFTNIFNIEAQKLSRLEQVELVLKISELDNRYWNIENMDDGNILRIIPLFNCNNITSSNPDDVILNWLENPLRQSRNEILRPYLVFQDLINGAC